MYTVPAPQLNVVAAGLDPLELLTYAPQPRRSLNVITQASPAYHPSQPTIWICVAALMAGWGQKQLMAQVPAHRLKISTMVDAFFFPSLSGLQRLSPRMAGSTSCSKMGRMQDLLWAPQHASPLKLTVSPAHSRSARLCFPDHSALDPHGNRRPVCLLPGLSSSCGRPDAIAKLGWPPSSIKH